MPDEREDAEVAAKVDGSELLTLVAALYRDEMRRAVSWRDRLDRTTNWAVVLTATLLTWAFSSAEHPHYVLLVAEIGVAMFVLVEARRYRVYDVWRSRVRLIEENVFANAIHHDGAEQEQWRKMLGDDLRHPKIKTPWLEALQRRLRRIYIVLFAILGIAWALRVTAFAEGELTATAAVGVVDGRVVTAVVAGLHLVLLVLAFVPMQRTAMGSLRETDYGSAWRD